MLPTVGWKSKKSVLLCGCDADYLSSQGACSEGQGEGFPWWGFGSEEMAGQLSKISEALPVCYLLPVAVGPDGCRQSKVEALVTSPQQPVPPYRQPFQTPDRGPTPRVRALPNAQLPTGQLQPPTLPEDEQAALPSDPEYVHPNKPEVPRMDSEEGVASAIFQQSQALSTLVAHLVAMGVPPPPSR